MTKSARFLHKNTKKYQFFTIFLSQMRPKPTKMRHPELQNFLQKFPKIVVLSTTID